ncbi:MAG: aminopeptidase N, partial [Micrococcales bacterium]|nr:aminopeptidase N [Micrococcales bacterium]
MAAIPDTNLTRAQARHRSETLQVHGYEIELDLTDAADPAVSTFATVSTIDLTSSEPNVLLDFIGESVDLVTIDAEPRPFAYDGARVEVGGIPAGRRVRIRVAARARYSHMGQGLHRYVDPADGLTYLYSHSEPSDARRFVACLDQPDLKAPFQVSVTAPSSWLALSNQPVTSSTRSGGATRHEFAATPPLSTYLLCVAAGPYRRWEDIYSDGATTVPLG